ncbi:zinc dependent phospholipase C family protein [Paenibacillus apiarius]|uniref:Zinc dependent phospholipase C family protein n=1 Tax=Paenibacillus apiarius TaxID=46240 RepID=A0ABT4DW41_9BACL|nr:zinc dependent phospholipase C family protein [Paenibacillus apiarius]MCY9513069.1 zinc dependent phospholipase C family protein [Paenibacillus apiarius]MCY9521573.1 zinc dependent phospholipase C family protein [Paenibacillus apiarius]MCY9551727.1 zinc dependent phospholipase C family protein [Paenibacillus apiarius]MCY9560485.1 zinc dependent phospholipase C family protein [Paenibacillus apiarius]MCY9685265.1 zinc dependent phospholipase C family protein [Paenibacillus apiarius]
MGSRIMHFTIATILAGKLGIHDESFLVGGIAPDASKHINAPKQKSHFVYKDAEGHSFVNHERFCRKYLSEQARPFHLGYYSHLIADNIWLQDIYYPKVKWLEANEKKETQQRYYNDFRRLNGILIDHYHLELKDMNPIAEEIDEIDWACLPALIADLKDDFERKDETRGEALQFFRLEDIFIYIEKSVHLCMEAIADKVTV